MKCAAYFIGVEFPLRRDYSTGALCPTWRTILSRALPRGALATAAALAATKLLRAKAGPLFQYSIGTVEKPASQRLMENVQMQGFRSPEE